MRVTEHMHYQNVRRIASAKKRKRIMNEGTNSTNTRSKVNRAYNLADWLKDQKS